MTAGHKSYVFASENETEFKDWLNKLSSVLQQNKLQEEKRAASLERGKYFTVNIQLELLIIILFLRKEHAFLATNTTVWDFERFGTKYESAIN